MGIAGERNHILVKVWSQKQKARKGTLANIANFCNIFFITKFCNKILNSHFACIAKFCNILLQNFVIVLIRELFLLEDILYLGTNDHFDWSITDERT